MTNSLILYTIMPTSSGFPVRQYSHMSARQNHPRGGDLTWLTLLYPSTRTICFFGSTSGSLCHPSGRRVSFCGQTVFQQPIVSSRLKYNSYSLLRLSWQNCFVYIYICIDVLVSEPCILFIF